MPREGKMPIRLPEEKWEERDEIVIYTNTPAAKQLVEKWAKSLPDRMREAGLDWRHPQVEISDLLKEALASQDTFDQELFKLEKSLFRYLDRDPYKHDIVSMMVGSVPYKLERAEHVAGLMRFLSFVLCAVRLAHAHHEVKDDEHLPHFDQLASRRISAQIAAYLLEAVPVLWLNEVFDAVPMAPRGADTKEWPFPLMFWAYEHQTGFGSGHQAMLGQLLMERDGEPWSIDFVIHEGEEQGKKIGVPCIVIRQLNDETEQQGVSGFANKIAGQVAWLNSPYITVHREAVSRAARRRAERAGAIDPNPEELRVIRLRSDKVKRPYVPGEEVDAIERDFRWAVRGHFRDQWYPSLGLHKQIFIAPFLKGPEGAPLRASAYKVNR